MAKIYLAKINLVDFSKKFRDGETTPNDIMKILFNGLDRNLSVDDLVDENIFYRLNIVDVNIKKSTVNGRLLKVSKTVEVETLPDEESNLIETNLLKNVVSSVPFSFKTDIQQLAFVQKNDFRKERFLDYFKKLIEEHFPEIGEVDFQLIFDKDELHRKLSRIDKLTLASFILVKPNGIADDLLEDIGNTLIDAEAKEVDLSFKGDRRKPLDKNSSILTELIDYVSNGWGIFKGKGFSEEENKTISIDTSKEVLKTYPVNQENKDSPLFIQNRAFNYDEEE
ncbi:hypothetical protein ACEN33_00010 [Ruoffia sp. FAM 24228]|uniref:hypothetical protein n=1 Tax=Ruoffia sp. FAM 24228 TaxID=3259517 RepID=UPI003884BE6A